MKKGLLGMTVVVGSYLSMGVALATPLRGQINKDQVHGGLNFDLTVGDAFPNYTVKGSTIARSQFSLTTQTPMDFSNVEVKKTAFVNGQPVSNRYANSGTLYVTAIDRRAQHLVLAGLPIEGRFSEYAFDNDLDFSRLTVNGAYSYGTLDYNTFSGRYTPVNGTRFGAYELRTHGNTWVFDHDNYAGQDLLNVNLVFGHILVRGTIQFSNYGTTATTGSVNLNIMNLDGTDVAISDVNASDAQGEEELRAFLGFLEIVSVDLSAD